MKTMNADIRNLIERLDDVRELLAERSPCDDPYEQDLWCVTVQEAMDVIVANEVIISLRR